MNVHHLVQYSFKKGSRSLVSGSLARLRPQQPISELSTPSTVPEDRSISPFTLIFDDLTVENHQPGNIHTTARLVSGPTDPSQQHRASPYHSPRGSPRMGASPLQAAFDRKRTKSPPTLTDKLQPRSLSDDSAIQSVKLARRGDEHEKDDGVPLRSNSAHSGRGRDSVVVYDDGTHISSTPAPRGRSERTDTSERTLDVKERSSSEGHSPATSFGRTNSDATPHSVPGAETDATFTSGQSNAGTPSSTDFISCVSRSSTVSGLDEITPSKPDAPHPSLKKRWKPRHFSTLGRPALRKSPPKKRNNSPSKKRNSKASAQFMADAFEAASSHPLSADSVDDSTSSSSDYANEKSVSPPRVRVERNLESSTPFELHSKFGDEDHHFTPTKSSKRQFSPPNRLRGGGSSHESSAPGSSSRLRARLSAIESGQSQSQSQVLSQPSRSSSPSSDLRNLLGTVLPPRPAQTTFKNGAAKHTNSQPSTSVTTRSTDITSRALDVTRVPPLIVPNDEGRPSGVPVQAFAVERITRTPVGSMVGKTPTAGGLYACCTSRERGDSVSSRGSASSEPAAVVTCHENMQTGQTTKVVVEHRNSHDVTTLFNPEIGLGDFPEEMDPTVLREIVRSPPSRYDGSGAQVSDWGRQSTADLPRREEDLRPSNSQSSVGSSSAGSSEASSSKASSSNALLDHLVDESLDRLDRASSDGNPSDGFLSTSSEAEPSGYRNGKMPGEMPSGWLSSDAVSSSEAEPSNKRNGKMPILSAADAAISAAASSAQERISSVTSGDSELEEAARLSSSDDHNGWQKEHPSDDGESSMKRSVNEFFRKKTEELSQQHPGCAEPQPCAGHTVPQPRAARPPVVATAFGPYAFTAFGLNLMNQDGSRGSSRRQSRESNDIQTMSNEEMSGEGNVLAGSARRRSHESITSPTPEEDGKSGMKTIASHASISSSVPESPGTVRDRINMFNEGDSVGMKRARSDSGGSHDHEAESSGPSSSGSIKVQIWGDIPIDELSPERETTDVFGQAVVYDDIPADKPVVIYEPRQRQVQAMPPWRRNPFCVEVTPPRGSTSFSPPDIPTSRGGNSDTHFVDGPREGQSEGHSARRSLEELQSRADEYYESPETIRRPRAERDWRRIAAENDPLRPPLRGIRHFSLVDGIDFGCNLGRDKKPKANHCNDWYNTQRLDPAARYRAPSPPLYPSPEEIAAAFGETDADHDDVEHPEGLQKRFSTEIGFQAGERELSEFAADPFFTGVDIDMSDAAASRVEKIVQIDRKFCF